MATTITAPSNPGFENGLTNWSVDTREPIGGPVVASSWDHVNDPAQAQAGSGFVRWSGDTTQPSGGGAYTYVRFFNDTKFVADNTNGNIRVQAYGRIIKAADAEPGFSIGGLGVVAYDKDDNALGEIRDGGLTAVNLGSDTGWQFITLPVIQNDPSIAYYKLFTHAASKAGAAISYDSFSFIGAAEYVPQPVVTPPDSNPINPGFEDGDSGWEKGADWTIVQNSGFTRDGTWAARWDGGNGSNSEIINDVREPVVAGQSVTASIYGSVNGANSSQGGVHVILVWYNSSGTRMGDAAGTIISGGGTSMRQSTVTATAPSGATRVSIGARAYRNSNPRPYFVDTASWNIVRDRTIQLTQPAANQQFTPVSQIPLRVQIGGTKPDVISVSYLVDGVEEAFSASAPYGVNLAPQALGSHTIQARLNLADGTNVLSNIVNITVAAEPEPPTLREYKASNAYTYLIGENFIGLGGAMPPTARVLGVEVLVDYTLEVMVRTKDAGITDPTAANADVAFDIVNGGTVEAVLLSNNGTSYTQLGAPMSNTIPINRVDFEIGEDGTSQGMRWTTFTGGEGQVVVGGEDQRFGLLPEFGSTFIDYGVGIRFTPNLATVPSYTEQGDAAYRFNVQSFKVRVYFDAGSVEYYFASPDKTQVLKGTLAAYYVYTGNFATSDASGVLQITPTLEQMDGTQRWIGSDWTIHSSYPPTDNNQIGEVGEVDNNPLLGMKYNGLPTQQQVRDNRSRYEFKTENFYGSAELNSMYGVHGLSRAFAYNGDFFYKIYTQADAEKDQPRHVANHHGHLALGFYGGRVDISVAGEPYNFNGVDGASSWAFGDKVVGLLPLSGTILGVFGAKSVWGISGTTVDNFATQVISPNMGAVEYTITDMGFPVYANSYGIYTLNQTQQYGDYLGQPMSQDISPWLRPRLIRKLTSDKEVVCAFPVRSKNQYRLCFSDGYVTSMTLNGQQVPTFSFQKYFYTPEGEDLPLDMYSYPSIVPAAVSSELDEAGEERIHIAPYLPRLEMGTSGGEPLPILSITGILQEGMVDEFYYGELSTSGFNWLQSALITEGNLPQGLSIRVDNTNKTIVVEGTPTEEGTYPIIIRAFDSTGRSADWSGAITTQSQMPQSLYVFYQNPDPSLGAIVFRRVVTSSSWQSLGSPNADIGEFSVGTINNTTLSFRSKLEPSTIYTTTDMVSFTQSPVATPNVTHARGCDLGDGVVIFPSQSSNAFCLRSLDGGATLLPIDVPGYNDFSGGSYISSGDEVLMININHVFVSSDRGASWALRNNRSGINRRNVNPRFAFDGTTICYPGEGVNVLVTSDNFVTRTSVDIPGTTTIERTAVIGSNWVAQDNDGRLWCADEATGPWEAATMPEGWAPNYETAHDLLATNHGFIASMRDGRIMESPTGKVWTNITPPLPLGNSLNSIALLG